MIINTFNKYNNPPGGPIEVTSGSRCLRMKSKTQCEEAATKLGLSDTKAKKMNVAGLPPYCYFFNEKFLYFNENGNADSECTGKRVCICKETGRD